MRNRFHNWQHLLAETQRANRAGETLLMQEVNAEIPDSISSASIGICDSKGALLTRLPTGKSR